MTQIFIIFIWVIYIYDLMIFIVHIYSTFIPPRIYFTFVVKTRYLYFHCQWYEDKDMKIVQFVI